MLDTRDAIRKAKAIGLDLVPGVPHCPPPVCKVMDYGEYTYQEKKKKAEAKKKQHRIEVKEVKFRPTPTSTITTSRKSTPCAFWKKETRSKATVFFSGRELTHANLGEKLIYRLAADLAELGDVEGRPRLEGRMMHVIIGPKKKK